MKINAYELQEGDVVTSLILDPAENFVVDSIVAVEADELIKVGGYTEDSGVEFNFVWGDNKTLTVDRSKVKVSE
jgi:hypothetical protein